MNKILLFIIVGFMACSRSGKLPAAKQDPFTPQSDTGGVKVSCRYLGTDKVGAVKTKADSLPVLHHSFLFRINVDKEERIKEQAAEHLDFGLQKDFFFTVKNGDVMPVMCQRESKGSADLSYLVVFEVSDSIRLPLVVGYNDKTFGSGPRYFQFSEFLNSK
jgi:hypothetical protein